jgi:hypothetical protein
MLRVVRKERTNRTSASMPTEKVRNIIKRVARKLAYDIKAKKFEIATVQCFRWFEAVRNGVAAGIGCR